MMIGDDEPMDPLVDPFGTIDNDPLKYYKQSDYFKDDTSSDEDLSSCGIPASLTIIPLSSARELKVHKIPAPSHSITVTKVNSDLSNFPYGRKSTPTVPPPYRRGRKKGSKNKFKKGVPIASWKETNNATSGALDLSKKMNGILGESYLQTELSKRLNTSPVPVVLEPKKLKKQYKPRKSAAVNGYPSVNVVPSLKESLDYLVVEVDPAELYPDDPMPRDKVYRKKKRGTTERNFECDICKKGFKCTRGVITHKSVKHNIEDLSGYYPCEICEEVFALKRDLTSHYLTHQDGLSRYPCPDLGCKITQADISGLVKHKKKVHPYLGTLGRTWFHTWGDR